MKRLLPVLVALAAIAAAVVVAARTRDQSSYRVAAIFDSARGMVAGQQVKVAGAAVGSIADVRLAPGPKALVVMRVDRRFAPFRADATCTILPQGLISENYVECDPGRSRVPLPAGAGGLPTVALSHTTVPVSLQDALNVLSLPTDERLRILLSELGIATAGRGEALNDLLRRANPALAQTRQVLSILDRERGDLARAVGQTDAVLARLAQRRRAVHAFVGRAATVTKVTAAQRGALAAAVRRLPTALDALRPGLRSLDRAAAAGEPLLASLRVSAPQVRALTATLPVFAKTAVPALRALGAAAGTGRGAARAAAPVVAHLRRSTATVRALAPDLDRLLVSTRSAGGIEGTLRVIYALATASGLYDDLSHIITFLVGAAPRCLVAQRAGPDLPGCSHKYSAPGHGLIPVNAPACGPRDPAWFLERCPVTTVGPLSAGLHNVTKHSPLTNAQVHRLLDFFLR